MKVRGRNGKWLGTGDRGTIGETGVIVVFKFGPGVGECGDHVSIWGENGNRCRRRSVNGEEGAIGGELVANFFFFNVEETSDVFDHLLMGESHFRAGWAVRGRRCDDVGGVASTVNGRRRARRYKYRGRGVGHCWAIEEVVKGIE